MVLVTPIDEVVFLATFDGASVAISGLRVGVQSKEWRRTGRNGAGRYRRANCGGSGHNEQYEDVEDPHVVVRVRRTRGPGPNTAGAGPLATCISFILYRYDPGSELPIRVDTRSTDLVTYPQLRYR
jgi:hypothetical protein